MAARPLCRECDGTGWILYRSETMEGELEEAYCLCPNCHAPRRCMGSNAGRPCPRPGTAHHGLGYWCEEHMEVIHINEGVVHAHEAIHYLRQWLRIAHDRADEFLETRLSEALGEVETWLRRAERELEQACEEVGDLD